MSINIQLQNKLLKLSGDTVTSDKITEALGYTPANNEHISDTDIHVSESDRANWNNKDYNALENLPNLSDDGSDNLMITDPDGNAIAKFDESGLTTTNVTTKSIQLDGDDLGSRLDSLESFSLPNILDNETGDLTIADENGNAIVKFDENGTTTTAIHAKEVFIDGENITTKVNEHLSDKTVHVTTQDKNKWDNKSEFSGNYNDLADKPNVSNDLAENSLDVMDNNGNIIVTVNENGVTTTQVTTNKLILGSNDVATVLDEHDGKIDILNADENTVGSVDKKIKDAITAENLSQYATDDDLSSHASNTELHVTKALQDKWNAKAEVSYVDEKVAGIVNSAPETLNTLNELADALGDDPNFATTVANQIGLKANNTDLEQHVENTTNHITADERITWNNKSEFSGNYNDLEDKPNITEDNSKEIVITDNTGNIIARIDVDGISTTQVATDTFILSNQIVSECTSEQIAELFTEYTS